ncbi:MAG: SDR family NAD(P)-dependent oxidoreductase [Prevotella sp.]
MDNRPSVIVMGATSGIGNEVAKIFAMRGWRVGVAGRREDILSKMVAENNGIVAYEVIDVTASQAIDGLHKLMAKMGGMDMYFHSSGIGYQNTALDADKELKTIETNCLGMARLVGEAFRYFEQHPETEGQIAVISSIARTKGLGAAPAYSASKRFTSNYLESLCQLTSIKGIRNIHISDIRPGFVKTPLIEGSHFPMQLDASKVAMSIVDGLERRKSVITINWLYRLLVFFWQMIPRFIWIRMRIKSKNMA